MILDLNMPIKDGREVLAEMKADDNLKVIPVIVLTTSSAERDVLTAYRLQASSFVTKPGELEAFRKVIRELEKYWSSAVVLPSPIAINF